MIKIGKTEKKIILLLISKKGLRTVDVSRMTGNSYYYISQLISGLVYRGIVQELFVANDGKYYGVNNKLEDELLKELGGDKNG